MRSPQHVQIMKVTTNGLMSRKGGDDCGEYSGGAGGTKCPCGSETSRTGWRQ
ncbi:hypothetical protein [Histophilus somni]|uniref:hypothetical protein n=1 Tax=Histophilus somni TaxID=731 RepID=UPI0038779B25